MVITTPKIISNERNYISIGQSASIIGGRKPANIMLNIRILRSRGEGIWYQTKAIEKGGMYIIGIFLFQWDGDRPLCYFAERLARVAVKCNFPRFSD